MNGIEYLNFQKIKWFPINIQVIDGKKELLPYTEEGIRPNYKIDFDNFELLNKRQTYKYDTIAMDTRNVQQIDIDSDEANNMFNAKDKSPYFLSRSKKLPHYFINLADNLEHPKTFKPFPNNNDIDLLNGTWSYASIDFVVENANMPFSTITIDSKKEKLNDNKSFIKSTYIVELLNIIDVKYCDEFLSWLRIGAGLLNCGYEQTVFDDFSKKSTKYQGTDKIWKQLQRNPMKDIGFGTLCYYAKESNVNAWEQMKYKLITEVQKTEIDTFLKSGSSLSHSVASILFYEAYKDKYVYSNGCWFELTEGGIYNKIYKDAVTILSKDLRKYMQPFIMNIIDTIEDNDKRKTLWKTNERLEDTNFKKHCVEEMKQDFLDRNLLEELDNNQKIIGFTNGVYDLENGIFRKGTTYDKISKTTRYSYNPEVNNENQLFLENLFDSYFETKETAHYFKKHLASFLEGGNSKEKIWFWVGQGRNGKGTTDSMLRDVLGDYYSTLHTNYYTIADKDSGRAHPELLCLENSRISMTHEPEGSVKFLTSKFKNISGADPLKVRDCHAGKDQIREFTPTFKPVIQTNHLPQFTDVDIGLQDRLIVIPFPYMFLDENNYDDNNKYHKKVDSQLKSKLKLINMDFFHFLLKYYKIYKSEGLANSKEITSCINNYKKEIDSVKTFMNEAIVVTNNDKDRISTTDLLYHHNSWCSNKLDRERFAKRLKATGFELKQRKVLGNKIMCISNIKWNDEFKKELNNCAIIEDF